MEQYAFLSYSDYDNLYFDQLYDLCRQGGKVEGKKAVDFFKLSSLSPLILREVWSLSSVFRQPYLSKEEFFTSLKYIALAQKGVPLSIENLRGHHLTLASPQFQGIQMPPPPIQKQPSHNPFDDMEEEGEEDFDDFQDAQPKNLNMSVNSNFGTSSHSNQSVPTVTHQMPYLNQGGIQQNQSKPNSTAFQAHDLLDIGSPDKQPSHILQTYIQPSQSLEVKTERGTPIKASHDEEAPKLESPRPPKNYEDILFEKIKGAQFTPPVNPYQQNKEATPPKKQSPEEGDDDWAAFEDATPKITDQKKKEEPKPVHRFDLINDAFAELIEPSQQQEVETSKVEDQKVERQTSNDGRTIENDEDDFDDFVDAPASQQKQQETNELQKSSTKNNANDLLSLYDAPFNSDQKSKRQGSGLKSNFSESESKPADKCNDEDDFDDFVDAGPDSSIQDFTENSIQDSNIFSNSNKEIENSFGDVSHEYDSKRSKYQPEPSQWIGPLKVSSQTKQQTKDPNAFSKYADKQKGEEKETETKEGEEDDFGEWVEGDQENTTDNQISKLEMRQSSQTSRQNDDLRLDDQEEQDKKFQNESQGAVSDQAPQPKSPPKPKVELNENNLLSGFMQEFGRSFNLKQQQRHQPHAEQQQTSASNGLDVSGNGNDSLQQISFTKTNELEVQSQKLLEQIKLFFQEGASLDEASAIDYSAMTESEFQSSIVEDKEKLKGLRQYLKTTIELPESEIQGTIDSHLKILDEVVSANKKKAEAAANEEFEEAVQFKNKVIQLKKQLLTYETVSNLLKKKPVLSTQQLLQRVVELDMQLNFAKHVIGQTVRGHIKKPQIIYKTMIFLKQKELGMFKLKQNTDDVVSAIATEIKTINKVLSQLSEEESELLDQLYSTQKFDKFIKGIVAMRRVTSLMQESLLIAEAQEDEKYSIDFEALLQEAELCQSELTRVIEGHAFIQSKYKDYIQEQEVTLEAIDDVDECLRVIRDFDGKENIVSQQSCSMCCCNFMTTGLKQGIVYNSHKYHPNCINLWLNKALVNIKR